MTFVLIIVGGLFGAALTLPVKDEAACRIALEQIADKAVCFNTLTGEFIKK